MGTPNGFKGFKPIKRMDKEKWKRIIQPDGDSDSSMGDYNWDDNINNTGGSSKLYHIMYSNQYMHVIWK